MPRTQDQIMEVIIRSPGCLLEEVVLECPGLTWNQVFTEIERMAGQGLFNSKPRDWGCIPSQHQPSPSLPHCRIAISRLRRTFR